MRLFDYVQLDDEHYLQVAPKDQGKADIGLFTVKTYLSIKIDTHFQDKQKLTTLTCIIFSPTL